MNDANNNLKNIDYGIKRIIRFEKINENDEKNDYESNELMALETETGASIVKIETLVSTRIVLLCNKKIKFIKFQYENLANGELYSKGSTFTGRSKDESKKNYKNKFIKVKFFEKDKSDIKEIDVLIHNISTGKSHLLAIDSNSDVWGWGSNTKCQIDPEEQESFTIDFPHKILRMSNLGDVIQVYAINDSSICIRKDNQIIIWGSPENGILGKDKMFSDPKNKKNDHFIAKSDFTEIINTAIIKENSDFTEEYINSRKLFNTKYNQIKRDTMMKKMIINQLEDKKQRCIEEAQQNLDNTSKFEIESDNDIQILKKKIVDFQNASLKIENKKKNLQEKMIEIDKEIRLLNNDHEKVVLKLAQKKSEIELKQSKRNKLENLKNNTDDDKSLPILNRELREVTAEIVNLTTLEESFTNNLEIIVSSLDAKNNERVEIAKQIADIIQNENNNIKFKYTLEDMIFIINEYHYKNTNNELNKTGFGERRNTVMRNNENGNNSIYEQQKLLKKFNELIVKIDELSFFNLNSIYVGNGVNLSTEMLVLDSNKRLKEQKENIFAEYESLNNFEKNSVETIMTMANNKLSLLYEQNTLISHLNTMFKNMKSETVKYYNSKASLKKDQNNQTILFEEDKNYQHLNQNEKNKFIFNSNTKDLILNFLKEAIYADDAFLRNNITNKTIKPDFKFNKNNSFTQIIIDNPLEIDDNNKKTSDQFKCDEDEIYELDDLVFFKRKERKK